MNRTGQKDHVGETIRISSRQFFYIIFGLSIGLGLVAVPPVLVREARQGLWLSMLLGTVADIAVAVMLYLLGRWYPRQTLFEYSQTVLGPALGRLVVAAYMFLFLYSAGLAVRNYADLFQLSMPETPTVVFVVVMCLVAAYGASRGLEAIGRTAEVLGPLGTFTVGMALLMLANRADLGNLLPPLPRPGGALHAGLLVAAWLGNCTIMGVLMAYHTEPARALLVKGAGVVTGVTVFMAMLLETVAVLGPELAARQLIPILVAFRVVEIADLVERMELLFMIVVLAAGIASVTALLAATAMGAAQMAGARDWKPLVWPLATLMGVLALASPSRADTARLFSSGYPLFALSIEAGLTATLLVVSRLRSASGSPAAPRSRDRRRQV